MAGTAGLFGNATANATVSWQAQPTFRGTWGILYECLVTLLLCTWTAFHLNIPAPGKSTEQPWRKLGWMIVGILAPEMVAFTAWTQYRSSGTLLKSMRKALGQPAPPTTWQKVKALAAETWISIRQAAGSILPWCSETLKSISRPSAPWPIELSAYGDEGKTMVKTYNLTQVDEGKPEDPEAARQVAEGQRLCDWTETHSWYAVMGGFAIDMRNLPRDFVPGSPRFQILSTDGLLLLARCKPELIPDISEEEILDKSKANGLKKFIVCVQATWFLVSTIFRMARGYPIALLELNTFAHALCALLVYFIWWSKPLDVAGSTLIDGRLCEDIVAFLAMASHYNGRRELGLFRYEPAKLSRPRVRFNPKPFPGAHPYWTSSVELDSADDGAVQARLKIPEHDPADPDRTCRVPESYGVLQMCETLYGFCFEVRNEKPPRSPHSVKQRPYIPLKAGDILRWRCASEAVERFLKHEEADQSYINFRGDSANPELNPDRVPDFLVDRIYNWPTNIFSFTKFRTRDIPTHFAFTLAGAFYGGLHLAASSAPFHSTAEFILWLLSSTGLCAVGPGVVLHLYTTFLLGWCDCIVQGLNPDESAQESAWWTKLPRLEIITVRAYFFFLYLPSVAALLLFARVFLIVECFLNLFRLDPKVFAIPSWADCFPHIN